MASNNLIKTLQEENYNKVIKDGNIFLTRIGFYRETDNPNIGDDLEGTRGFRFDAKEKIKFSNSDLPPLGNIKIEGGYTQIDPGSNVNLHEILPDILVYCVSDKVQSNFGNKSFEIIDPNGFGKLISSELKKEFGSNFLQGTLKKVKYGEHKDEIKTIDDFTRANSSFYQELYELYTLNPSKFVLESEWRYVFLFKPEVNLGNVGFSIFNKEIHKYCKF